MRILFTGTKLEKFCVNLDLVTPGDDRIRATSVFAKSAVIP